jgi:hypothetical protein
MQEPTLTITHTPHSGKIMFSWLITDGPSSPNNLREIKATLNGKTAESSIIEKIYPPTRDDVPITFISMDSNDLVLGVETFVLFEFVYDSGLTITSNPLVVINRQVPATPLLTLNTSVRPEDMGLSINLNSLYIANSLSDGFANITMATVIISKVGGNQPGDFQIRNVAITGYNNWYLVGLTNLLNDELYEVAVKVRNSIGESALSNTILAQPADTPSKIDSILAEAKLSNLKRNSLPELDVRGDIILHWKKPDDYDNLIEYDRRVTKYILSKQEYTLVEGVETAYGEPIFEDLIIPAHILGARSGASFELITPVDIDSITYDYKHEIIGSVDALGKIFKFNIVAENLNGNGPVSDDTSSIKVFKTADSQPFLLLHENTISYATATALVIYSGRMSLKITAGNLSSLNGADGFQSDTATLEYTPGDTPPKDEVLSLQIIRAEDAEQMYDGNVKFIKTGDSDYIYDLEDDNINSTLDLGVKYRFVLYRKFKDPKKLANEFKSLATDIVRTKFKSPAAISDIQSYSVNDDLTPVTNSDGSKSAIRLIFNHLTSTQLNGMDVFGEQIQYYAYQQSTIVVGQLPIQHNSALGYVGEFIIAQAAVGSSVANYIRTKSWNPELAEFIDGVESTPAVYENTIGYPLSVENVAIIKTSEDKINVSFQRQSNSQLVGNPSSSVRNRILLYEDGVTVPTFTASVMHNTTTTYMSPDISLVTGKSYAVVVIAERIYNKLAHDAGVTTIKRFDNAIVRNFYFTKNFIMNGTPGAPTDIEAYPTNSNIEINYNSPDSLSGVASESLRYHFFLNKESTDFPYFSAGVPQASVADISGTTSAILSKAFDKKADSNIRAQAIDLVPETEYSFAMRVIGTVGGNSLLQTSYSHSDDTSIVHGVQKSNTLNITTLPTVPEESIQGELSVAQTIMVMDAVSSPTNVQVSPQENKLLVVIDKNTSGSINDLLVVVDSGDATDMYEASVVAFDTRIARTVQSGSGLFNLESFNSIAEQPTDLQKYKFERINDSGIFKYKFIMPDLVNGRPYSLSIRYIKKVNDIDAFSEAVVISRAPEAPSTVILNPTFSVDDKLISIKWDAPLNSGGASIGTNGPLMYRISHMNADDSVISTFNTSNTIYTITDNLVNNTNYKIIIAAYYIKGNDGSDVVGPQTQANPASGNLIRPNPRPLGGALTVAVGISNKITGSFILPSATEIGLFPTLRYDVYLRHKATPAISELVQSFSKVDGFHPVTGLAYTVNSLNALTTITLSDITTLSSSPHPKPLNGFEYEVVVAPIPDYTYAQPSPKNILSATPYGLVNIQTATAVIGSNGKIFDVVVNLNGSGSVNNIVTLAKSDISPNIIVQNLSDGLLPARTVSGSIETATYFIAANQIVKFQVSFAVSVGAINHMLIVVVTEKSSDTYVFPVTGGFFI